MKTTLTRNTSGYRKGEYMHFNTLSIFKLIRMDHKEMERSELKKIIFDFVGSDRFEKCVNQTIIESPNESHQNTVLITIKRELGL